MRVLDLFSGIGGFSLGLERAGMKTVAFCEIDPYCRAVLKKHWPEVPCYDDVRTIPAIGGIDVVCGGWPCQTYSSAARGRNNHPDMWPWYFKVVERERPTWLIGENVTHIDGVALEQVASDLETIGYEIRTFEIPACAVGHDHRRARLWICGHSNGDSESVSPVDAETPRMQGSGSIPGSMGEAYGVPSRLDRLRALGNAVVPQIVEIIGQAIIKAQASRA